MWNADSAITVRSALIRYEATYNRQRTRLAQFVTFTMTPEAGDIVLRPARHKSLVETLNAMGPGRPDRRDAQPTQRARPISDARADRPGTQHSEAAGSVRRNVARVRPLRRDAGSGRARCPLGGGAIHAARADDLPRWRVAPGMIAMAALAAYAHERGRQRRNSRPLRRRPCRDGCGGRAARDRVVLAPASDAPGWFASHGGAERDARPGSDLRVHLGEPRPATTHAARSDRWRPRSRGRSQHATTTPMGDARPKPRV